MKKILVILTVLMALATSAIAAGGFDQFGYNYKARVFVGSADGVDRVLDGKVWGDSTYANDHLVMKWSKAWDDARFNGAPWGPDAWEDNEWNGMAPGGTGGSGETWHYKIIWVGPQLQGSPYWRDGGYDIWGQFEVIMDQGVSINDYSNYGCESNPGGHWWCTLATPNGYGTN